MADTTWAKNVPRCIVCGTRRAEAEPACGRCDGHTLNRRTESDRLGGHVRGLKAFGRGFSLPFRGLGFMLANFHRLWLYVLLPIAINLVLFAGVIALAIWLMHGPIHHLFASDAWWFQAIEVVLEVLLLAVMLAATYFAFTAVGALVAAPFSELLSEKVEDVVMGRPTDEPFSWRQLVRDVVIPLLEGLKLLALQLAVLAVGVLFLWVPVVGQVPLLVAMAFFAGLDYLDPVLERKRYRTREKIAFLWRHKALCMGFGTACYVALLVPFLPLFILPVSVIGGTLMYLGAPDK